MKNMAVDYSDNIKEKVEARIIGFIIKKEREKKGITASTIARELQLSKQYFSEIERGTKNISYAVIERIMDYLEVKFTFNYHYELMSKFYLFLNYYYERDIKKGKELLQFILYNTTHYTFDYPTIILLEYILSVLKRSKYRLPLEFTRYLRMELYSPFLYFKGYEFYLNKNYEKSLEYIEQAILYVQHLHAGIHFIATIYYLKALVLNDSGNYISSIKYFEKAKKEFMKDYSLYNSLYSNFYQANAYANLGHLREAVKMYNKLLKEPSMKQDKKFIILVEDSLYTCLLWNEKYDELLAYMNEYMLCNQYIRKEIYLILSIVYYELGDKKTSMSYFKFIKFEHIENIFIKNLINIHRYRLQNDKKAYEKALYKCLNQMPNKMRYAKIFIMKHLMKYYEDIKAYEKAYTYANKVIRMIEYQK